MKVDFDFICDYAEVTGKINALGIGFDTIFAPKVPCNHSLFFLVFQLRASTVEAGGKNLELSLIDDDGNAVIPTLRSKIVVQTPTAGTESIVRVATRFNNVKFPRYGLYSIHAVVEGLELFSVQFKISPPQETK